MIRAGIICVFVLVALSPRPARGEDTAVALSEKIGSEIDSHEASVYGLFPDLPTLQTARIYRQPDGRYRIDYAFTNESGDLSRGSRRISADAFEATRAHVRMVDAYEHQRSIDPDLDARALFFAALQYSHDLRYELAVASFESLRSRYPEQYIAFGAAPLHDDAIKLRDTRNALFVPNSLIDQSGRTNLYIFAGYYGIFWGIAIPSAFDANTPEPYALALITIPTVSVIAAYQLSRNRNVTDAHVDLITAGGWLGTWQGLGWAGVADKSSEEMWAWGLGAGALGVLTAAAINRDAGLTEGHASLTNSAVWWGAWFGLLVGLGSNADSRDDGVLQSMLVGSAATTAGTFALARGSTLTRRRVRLMNLGGVLGAIVGLGFAVALEMDDDAAVASIFGVTSVGGAYVALRQSGPPGSQRSFSEGIRPVVGMRGPTATPVIGLAVDF